MILTDEHIEGARSEKGGWNKHQLHILGVAWPPPKGWKKKLAGSEIDPEVFEEFRRLGTICKQERAELNRRYAQRIARRQGG